MTEEGKGAEARGASEHSDWGRVFDLDKQDEEGTDGGQSRTDTQTATHTMQEKGDGRKVTRMKDRHGPAHRRTHRQAQAGTHTVQEKHLKETLPPTT